MSALLFGGALAFGVGNILLGSVLHSAGSTPTLTFTKMKPPVRTTAPGAAMPSRPGRGATTTPPRTTAPGKTPRATTPNPNAGTYAPPRQEPRAPEPEPGTRPEAATDAPRQPPPTSEPQAPSAPQAPGAQQVPNPMGYSSQGDYLGGVISHAINAPRQGYSIAMRRGHLISKAGISDYRGGDNEALIQLAHASYIAEANKYNVVFG